jgi:NAD(P)-dependent dehydrogenase (short-subunit alcohol dehydrogenase family)
MFMQISGSTALITGASRGLGRHFAEQLINRGAKVYATARDPERVDLAGAVRLRLDITDPASVAAAAEAATDVSLLINNAGISLYQDLVTGDLDKIRRELETGFHGTLTVVRAFAPVLAANGGGAILNVLSVASWVNRPILSGYGASKSAAWALTNGLRIELAQQRTQVVGLHAGFIDTDLARNVEAPKSSPAEIVRTTLDALERGDGEVLADEVTRLVHRHLSADPPAYFQSTDALRSRVILPAE